MKIIWKIDSNHILRFIAGRNRPSFMTEGVPKNHGYFDCTLNGAPLPDNDVLAKRHNTYFAFRMKDKRYVKLMEHHRYGPILIVDGEIRLPINRWYKKKCPQCKKKNDPDRDLCLICKSTLPSAKELLQKRYQLKVIVLSLIIVVSISIALAYKY